MSNGKIGVSEPLTPDQYLAAYTFSEDALTKLLQRITISTSAGAEIDFSAGMAGSPAGGVSSVQGFGYNSAVTITRPGNTTAYAATDTVGGPLTFPNAGPSGGGSVIITGAQLELDIGVIPSGMTSFRLYLYNVTPPSALSDNDPWDLSAGDRASFMGYLDLGSPLDLGSTCYVEVNNLVKQVVVSSGGSLYAYLVTTTGYTPASNSEIYKVTLHAVGV
ncbi:MULTISPECIES: hypothetical protein [unclassified Phenylobacterium]|jgi:hypothetical protein|uniref:hypothetical protein n=1 Tax=unclassified Phenylobacterium TaxID=2640670 RepID=UPI00083AF1F0|nr:MULTISPECIES: hypothetical protein [unclassified Phenylobacterium]